MIYHRPHDFLLLCVLGLVVGAQLYQPSWDPRMYFLISIAYLWLIQKKIVINTVSNIIYRRWTTN